ncbi:hypothetical protein E2C01_102501 [Portunus trituberculatus]|uniref:Uncharacterized protein n=1 Tax=Portunus trituberculatus TaxID=210409 RepID=A0A5B7KIP1_PORTR|nr:hypothetical protein [Portunus trituberculatus]
MCEIRNESFNTVFTVEDYTETNRTLQCTKRILEDYWTI